MNKCNYLDFYEVKDWLSAEKAAEIQAAGNAVRQARKGT
jgi:hypothetical protein